MQSPSWAVEPCEPLEPAKILEGRFYATPGRDTPALTPFPVLFAARLVGPAPLPPGEPMLAQGSVMAAYNGTIEVRVPTAIFQVDGREAVAIDVTNFGNGITRVESEIVEGHGLPPEAIVLDPAGMANSKGSVEFLYERAGDWNEEAVTVRVTPHFAYDDKLKGESVDVHLLFRNGDTWGQMIPGPALPLLLVALGALARRRL